MTASPTSTSTALEGDRLFHNEGNFKFRDVTARERHPQRRVRYIRAWFDYDRDGSSISSSPITCQWTPAGDLWCSLDAVSKSYCTPESYKGQSSRLFHNLGNAGSKTSP